jgi:glutathione S-transferase
LLIAELPALVDGNTVVHGYEAIVAYLARISQGKWSLDTNVDDNQRKEILP